MESPLGLATVHSDHEPLAVPRRTESADKSDALQTLRASGRVSGGRVSVWSACVFSAAFPRLRFDGRAGSWKAQACSQERRFMIVQGGGSAAASAAPVGAPPTGPCVRR